ncbi:oxygenase MpaB family protein [Streptomyces sp. NPDC002054]|uniref:oxygenase MpaB family protein n=1 Tax=Streptomyces sp. NPDC002054 TaxID=3154663 RepID=UPI0033337461
MQRYDRLKEILRLDPDQDFLTIYRLTATYEFPWDFTRALELALYRTYAVPSIGRLLAETAEFTDRPQRRYDDTALLLDAVVEHGFESDPGRTAIRRINQMHRSYDISNEDMRYVLCTFVVIPKRWLDAYGWRALTAHEWRACANYYATLGRHMGIKDIPASYEEFESTLDAYEKEHFGWDEGGRKVADATLDLMASWYPAPLAPLLRGASLALLDEPLLQAFRYEQPRPAVRKLVRGALRLRGRAVRLLPPRSTPHYARQNPEIKSYPGGYDVGELGTHPVPGSGGCPVPHQRRAEGADAQPGGPGS